MDGGLLGDVVSGGHLEGFLTRVARDALEMLLQLSPVQVLRLVLTVQHGSKAFCGKGFCL